MEVALGIALVVVANVAILAFACFFVFLCFSEATKVAFSIAIIVLASKLYNSATPDNFITIQLAFSISCITLGLIIFPFVLSIRFFSSANRSNPYVAYAGFGGSICAFCITLLIRLTIDALAITNIVYDFIELNKTTLDVNFKPMLITNIVFCFLLVAFSFVEIVFSIFAICVQGVAAFVPKGRITIRRR